MGSLARGRLLGGIPEAVPIAADQRLLLGPAPALDATLVGDGIRVRSHGSARTSVTGRRALVYLAWVPA